MIEEMTVHIPVTLMRRHGRKRMIIPDDAALPEETEQKDNCLILALLRAWKWQRMLEADKATSVEDLARQINMSSSYLMRVLRLNFLAPDIREAILDGRQPKGLRVIDMLKPFSPIWEEQRSWLGFI
ncbi:MAG: hypothetical protein PHD48_07575 [Alphaproteobacteria bacterium]|nr:hypothetical protein [Alphaproteobacteria bacterium]